MARSKVNAANTYNEASSRNISSDDDRQRGDGAVWDDDPLEQDIAER